MPYLGVSDTINALLRKHYKAKRATRRWQWICILVVLLTMSSLIAGLWVFERRAERQFEHALELQAQVRELEDVFAQTEGLLRELVARDVQRTEEIIAIRQMQAKRASGF